MRAHWAMAHNAWHESKSSRGSMIGAEGRFAGATLALALASVPAVSGATLVPAAAV
jgi:hypothetical protein